MLPAKHAKSIKGINCLANAPIDNPPLSQTIAAPDNQTLIRCILQRSNSVEQEPIGKKTEDPNTSIVPSNDAGNSGPCHARYTKVASPESSWLLS